MVRPSEAHLERAQRLARVGSREWTAADGTFSQPELARMHGWE